MDFKEIRQKAKQVSSGEGGSGDGRFFLSWSAFKPGQMIGGVFTGETGYHPLDKNQSTLCAELADFEIEGELDFGYAGDPAKAEEYFNEATSVYVGGASLNIADWEEGKRYCIEFTGKKKRGKNGYSYHVLPVYCPDEEA